MEWLESYLSDKKDESTAYRSLFRLCQRFSERHGFSQRVPCYTKIPSHELGASRVTFAQRFWAKYKDLSAEMIINADETAVHYDMPPMKTLAKVGGSSRVDSSEKHSDRLTAVLSVRSNGMSMIRFC